MEIWWRDVMNGLKRPVYIDEEDIPASARRKHNWEMMFSEIPSGKARQIGQDEVNYATIRQALKRLQSVGKFKNYYIKTKKIGTQRVCYVVNSRNK